MKSYNYRISKEIIPTFVDNIQRFPRLSRQNFRYTPWLLSIHGYTVPCQCQLLILWYFGTVKISIFVCVIHVGFGFGLYQIQDLYDPSKVVLKSDNPVWYVSQIVKICSSHSLYANKKSGTIICNCKGNNCRKPSFKVWYNLICALPLRFSSTSSF